MAQGKSYANKAPNINIALVCVHTCDTLSCPKWQRPRINKYKGLQ